MILHRDRQGRPIADVLEWAKLMDDENYRFVRREALPNGLYVVTVWEGIEIPRHIFYTGVFAKGPGEEGWAKSLLSEVHSDTEAGALAAHEAAVAKWGGQ